MRWIALATVFWGSMMGVGFVVADDVDDVKAAYLQHIANSNSGNVDGFVGQHLPGHSAFGPTGALLTRYDSTEGEKKLVRAALDAGRAANPGRSSVRAFSNVQVRHRSGDSIRWHQPPKNSEGFIDVDQTRWPVEGGSRPPVRFAGG